ncbi:MAG: endonuclease MutS2, partial [Candidatus Polarisedimenticolia bacterium]
MAGAPAASPADRRTLEGLEFDAVKRLMEPLVRTPPGRRRLAGLLPACDPVEVARRKRLAGDALRYRTEEGRLGPGGLDDPEPVLQRLAPEGSVLEGLEVSRLLGMLRAASGMRRAFAALRSRYPALAELAAQIPDLSNLTQLIEGKVASDGRLEDSASPDLAAARRRIVQLEASLNRRLQETLERAGGQGLLQDSYVTVRNGRFVIPLRADARGGLPGVVHATSSTGATLFVEPLETLELNNDLVAEREREQAEVRRILTAWSAALRLRLPEIEVAVERVGDLDLLGAIAELGGATRSVLATDPEPGGGLALTDARHPVLEAGLASRGRPAIPLRVEMLTDGGALVLSGPNAGGKTVAMKTIGLLALMNQAGMPVPAGDAVLPIFHQILADIGDHQSIEESLSTFSARMVRVTEMAGILKPPSLVLLDEVGAGTDPEEAGALAVAIVDHFRKAGAAVVATTHHGPLKTWAQTTPGAGNACMEIDEATLRPTYRLVPGMAGRSGGVDVAQRLGLPETVVAQARAMLSPRHVATQESMAHLKRLSEEKEQELELLKAQRAAEQADHERARQEADKRLQEMERGWREAIADALDRVERAREEFLAAIQDRTIALQLRAESRRQARRLREQVEAAAPPVTV